MSKRTVTPWAMAREARFWWRRDAAVLSYLAYAVATIALGLLTPLGGAYWGLVLLVLPLAVLAGVTAWWRWDRLVKPLSSAETTLRADEHNDHNHGLSSWMDVGENNLDVRRDAPTLRPSLEGRNLRKIDPSQWSARLGTLGANVGFYTWEQELRTSLKQWEVCTGAPQMGKTAKLGDRIIDHPGSALVTSTRVDLLKTTGAMRSEYGTIRIFNPLGHDRITSTIRWNPLFGCTDMVTAERRAAELIAATQGESASWTEKARERFPVFLHVAAVAGLRLRDVARWVESDDIAWTVTEMCGLIEEHLDGDADLTRKVKDTLGQDGRQRFGYMSPMAEALRWLRSPNAAEIGDAPLDHPDFVDIGDLIRSGTDTIYLVCPRDHSGITPLTNALTSEIAFQIIKVADGGRLDPPFLMALDEAYLTCPGVDLAKWTSDMGGAGCPGVITLQSLAQLNQAWGAGAAAVITGNAGVLTILGGTKDEKDLSTISTLTGTRMKEFDEDDDRPVSTLNAAAISQLGEFQALVIMNGIRPTRVTTPKAFERKDVDAATKCTVCGGSAGSHRLDGVNADHEHAPRWSPPRDVVVVPEPRQADEDEVVTEEAGR